MQKEKQPWKLLENMTFQGHKIVLNHPYIRVSYKVKEAKSKVKVS